MSPHENPLRFLRTVTQYLAIFIIGFSSTHAQQHSILTNLTSFEKSGDKKFYLFSYKAAALDYEQAIAQHPEKEYLKIKVAECYRLLNEPLLVEKWYSQVIHNDQLIKPEHKMHYAQALSSNGKYQESKKWLEAYQQDINNDSRVSKKLSAIESLNVLLKDSIKYVVVPLTINSPESDFSPTYYQDGIVFVSGRKQTKAMKTIFAWNESQFLELYFSKGSENGSHFEPKLFHQNINTNLHEGPLAFYENESKMIFTRNNILNRKKGESKDGIVKLKLYSSARSNSEENWSKPEQLPFNSNEYSVGHPAITKSGTTLYFASDMPGGFGGTDIYKSVKVGDTWSKPENLGAEINTEGNEVFPFIYNDNVLYYSSNGMGGLGGLDIYRAELTGKIVRNLGAPINSSVDDFGWITRDDGETGYFSSNRKPGVGSDDIYYFSVIKRILRVIVYDYETGARVPDAVVSFFDGEIERNKFTTADDGSSDLIVNPEKNYVVKVSKKDYLPSEGKLESIMLMNKEIQQIQIPLIRQTQQSSAAHIDSIKTIVEFSPAKDNIQGKVSLAAIPASTSNESIPATNLKIKIYQIVNGAGIQEIAVLGNTLYHYDAANNSFVSDAGKILFSLKAQIPTDLNQRQYLFDAELSKLGISAQYQLITNIYYDYNKAFIRNDASAILDHLVNLMLDYPALSVQLLSHTDSRGSLKYNDVLSKKRATAAKEYLINEGIETSRIKIGWHGETQLVNQCGDNKNCDENSHQSNRRTEISIINNR